MSSAADLLRESRTRARLTQGQVAAAAGVTQSVVSAYESGRREPSFEQLARLVAATGNRLAVSIEHTRISLLEHVRSHRDELVAALEPLGASNIRIFGSVARGTETAASDVDLLVDIDASVGLFALASMRSEAETILGHSVDIAPATSLKPDVRRAALADAVPL